MIDFDKLRAPFPPERISWRVGSTNQDKSRGLALAYIDARDVQDRLDEVCGPAGWQCRYPHANGKTVCEVGIAIENQRGAHGAEIIWIWKADGAGDTDVEAEKGALSDAFKRAAVRWGIGRYLYDVDAPWVALEPAGRSFKIKDSELPKLRALLGGKPAPKEAPAPDSPTDSYVTRALSDIAGAKSNDELTTWATVNKPHIEALADDQKQKIRTAYQRKFNSLKEAA